MKLRPWPTLSIHLSISHRKKGRIVDLTLGTQIRWPVCVHLMKKKGRKGAMKSRTEYLNCGQASLYGSQSENTCSLQ